MAVYRLAQLNIAKLLHPIDAPETAGFSDALDEINALAEGSPGFVWRLKADDGNATSFRFGDDDMIVVNLSVWQTVAACQDYVYRSAHGRYLARRKEWFDRMPEAYLVAWWVPAGHEPTLEEAGERLAKLRADGPTAEAFTFKTAVPPPDERS